MELLNLAPNQELLVWQRPTETSARPRRARVVREAIRFLWLRVEGLSDNLRVPKSTGKGSLYGMILEAMIPTPEELERIRRLDAEDRLRGALHQLEAHMRTLGVRGLDHLTREQIEAFEKVVRAHVPTLPIR